MKVAKWYEVVDVEEVPENDTWTVTLDGRCEVWLHSLTWTE